MVLDAGLRRFVDCHNGTVLAPGGIQRQTEFGGVRGLGVFAPLPNATTAEANFRRQE